MEVNKLEDTNLPFLTIFTALLHCVFCTGVTSNRQYPDETLEVKSS